MTEVTVMERCDLPGCPVVKDDGVLVTTDGGKTVWCIGHAADDWLPTLRTGRCGGCVACRRIGLTWTLDGLCLHERCRRTWAAGRPIAQPVGAVKHGAYGRRSGSAQN